MALSLPGIVQCGKIWTSGSYCAVYLIAVVQEPDGIGQTKIYADVYALLNRGAYDNITLLDNTTDVQRTWTNMSLHIPTPSGINGGAGIDLALPDGMLPKTEGLYYMGRTASQTFSTSSLAFSNSNIGDAITANSYDFKFVGTKLPTGSVMTTSPSESVFMQYPFGFYDFDKVNTFLSESGYEVEWTDDGLVSGTVEVLTTYTPSTTVLRNENYRNGDILYATSNVAPGFVDAVQTSYPGYGISAYFNSQSSNGPFYQATMGQFNNNFSSTLPTSPSTTFANTKPLNTFLTHNGTAMNISFRPHTVALYMPSPGASVGNTTPRLFIPITNAPSTPYYTPMQGTLAVNTPLRIMHYDDDMVPSGKTALIYASSTFKTWITSPNTPITSSWANNVGFAYDAFPQYSLPSTYLMARISYDGGATWSNWADQSAGDFIRRRATLQGPKFIPIASNYNSYNYLVDENGDHIYIPMNTEVDIKLQYKLVNTSTELGGETSVYETSYTNIPYTPFTVDSVTIEELSPERLSVTRSYTTGENNDISSTSWWLTAPIAYKSSQNASSYSIIYPYATYPSTTTISSSVPYANRQEAFTALSSITNKAWVSTNRYDPVILGGGFVIAGTNLQDLGNYGTSKYNTYITLDYLDPVWSDLEGVQVEPNGGRLIQVSTVTPPAKLETWALSTIIPANGSFTATLLATLRHNPATIYPDGYPGNLYDNAKGFGPRRLVTNALKNPTTVQAATDYFLNDFELQSHLETRYSLDNGTTWTEWQLSGQTQGVGYTITSNIEGLPAGQHVVVQGRQYWRSGSWYSPIDEIEFDTPPLPPDIDYLQQTLIPTYASQRVQFGYEQTGINLLDGSTLECQYRWSSNGGQTWNEDWTTFATNSDSGTFWVGQNADNATPATLYLPFDTDVLFEFRAKKTTADNVEMVSDSATMTIHTDEFPETRLNVSFDPLNRENLTVTFDWNYSGKLTGLVGWRWRMWLVIDNTKTGAANRIRVTGSGGSDAIPSGTTKVFPLNVDSGLVGDASSQNLFPNLQFTLGANFYKPGSSRALPGSASYTGVTPRPILGLAIDENGNQKKITDIATTDVNQTLTSAHLDKTYERFHIPE